MADGSSASFEDGVLSILPHRLTNGTNVTLTPTLAHALGRALLVYANRNGVGRETLDEPPLRGAVASAEVGEEYRRAVRDWTVTSPVNDPDAPR